jgi:8-oxo-dGTP pyrophosphatase MutT (NUDIX family)
VLETSAGGIVYRVQDGQPLFLLIRDSYRNWGFPKGHLESGEAPEQAAVREVEEETGLGALRVDGAIETIDWFFRFRGKLVHKVCHFYLMRTHHRRTNPQRDEGITACRWAPFEEATRLISYANARAVLVRAHDMVQAGGRGAPRGRGADGGTPAAPATGDVSASGDASGETLAAEPAAASADASAAPSDATSRDRPRRRRSRSRRRRGGGGAT